MEKSRTQNRPTVGRGYLLHRLLCVHFRLEIRSRWDVEISAEQLERLVLGSRDVVQDVLKEPTKRSSAEAVALRKQPGLFEERRCPILNEACPTASRIPGLGFLSCRLPEAGRIRDAVRLIRKEFASASSVGSVMYEIRTAEDYPPAGDIACKVCKAFAQSDFVLVELSRLSPSVSMELGLAIARRLPTYILFNKDEQPEIPEPFGSLEYISYSISPDSVKRMIHDKLVPFLSDDSGGRGTVRLGPIDATIGPAEGIFVALPATDYYQKTVLPELEDLIERADLGPVITEYDGQALQDLQRAAIGISKARYCLIDTTFAAPTRALYLGLAQGYRKPFANLIDAEQDPSKQVFTNARSKAEITYRDAEELCERVRGFLRNRGERL